MELVYPNSPAPVYPRPSYLNPAYKLPDGAEILPIVRENGMVIGRADRRYVHSGSLLLHPVVHLHLLNRNCELYIQKRAMTKDLLPGFWDAAVGGHVGYGESIAESLVREAYEELHIYDFHPNFIKSYVWESGEERELANVYAAIGNFSPEPDPAEVETGRWWTFEEIEAGLGKSVFCPNFEFEFPQIRRSLEAML